MAPLRLVNLVASGWSVLHGQTIKAANTRALAPFLVELSEELYPDDTDDYSRLVKRVCRSWNRFYEILYNGGVFLNAGEKDELRRVLNRLGAAMMQLREISRQTSLFAWQITPKTHMLQHFSGYSAVVNPRFLMNYQEDSSVGTVTRVWSRSAAGRYRRTVQRMVLMKLLVALMIRLETDNYV
jgi:hypothetical protein